jgi:glycolate oxidase iron-sulfur subunit
MQTRFNENQLADPAIRDCERHLRACVHCGFCLPTCPTYALLGNELDSPRGRIYLIKDMLENDRPAGRETALHVDRCLSCLGCMTACPSGVHYQHLIDHARAHVEATYRRPWHDRWLRAVLAWLLPYPDRFRLALQAAQPFRWAAKFLPGRMGAMLALVPRRLPPRERTAPARTVFPAEGERRGRVALIPGCAQQTLAPSIDKATIRLLNRHGVEVVVPGSGGCCGAILHHLGKAEQARALASGLIGALRDEINQGLDAVIANASGCGTEIKDYGHIFRDDPDWAEPARQVSALSRDISEYLAEQGLKPAIRASGLAVAYHSACSLQHGQRITEQPKALLASAGFTVKEVPEGHLCCGSAGTYNLLQPEIAIRLRDRKLANIGRTAPDVIAAGNIGCITQLASGTAIPVVHTVELLDWATGGPRPAALDDVGRA